jgi:hypothetical protein
MRRYISYAALGVALAAGASAAQAQTVDTVIAPQPGPTVVETVRTVSTTAPQQRIVNRHVVRTRTGNRVTTTRTTVTERIVPAPAVVPAEPTYTEVVQAPPAVGPAYPRLYDVVTPAPGAPGTALGTPNGAPAYRYVYEPDRILVIDPYSNIAVQALPR